jgi:hypothetical protein
MTHYEAGKSFMRMYEKFGFRVLNQITLPIINLPQWEMVREHQNQTQ